MVYGFASLYPMTSTIKPFFSQSGFAVEARQRVEVRGAVLANARMVKVLPGSHS